VGAWKKKDEAYRRKERGDLKRLRVKLYQEKIEREHEPERESEDLEARHNARRAYESESRGGRSGEREGRGRGGAGR